MSKRISHKKPRSLGLAFLLAIAVMLLLLIGCNDGGGVSGGQQDEEGGSGGASSAAWIIDQLTSGLTDYEKDKCQGWILNIVGLSQPNPDQDMIDALDVMNQKLDTIISDLTVIKTELDSIMKQIKISMDVIINNEQQLSIKVPQDTINNAFINLQAFQSSEIGTDTGKKNAADMAEDIFSTARSNIDLQIYSIYSGVLGLATQSNGVLNALTSSLVDHTGDGELLGRYQALQSYFKTLLQVQLKGANMMVEALHYRDNPLPSLERGLTRLTQIQPGDYPGTAKEWWDKKFMPMLADEVEEFLRCTERLVLAECDLRTDAAGVSQAFLPDDAETIFSQADFLAAQIAPSRHSFGLVVRVIGEPDTVKAISTQYQVMGNEQAMQPVQLGVDKKDVRMVPVEQWNNWPDGSAQKYMQWNWHTYSSDPGHSTTGFLQYTLADEIAVAQYALADATEGASYAVNTTFPNEYATATVTAILLDDDMKPAVTQTAQEGDDPKPFHVWAHTTLPIRHIQGGAVWYEHEKSGYDENHGVWSLPNTTTRADVRPPLIFLQMGLMKSDSGYGEGKSSATISFGIKNGTTDPHIVSALVRLNYDMSCDFHAGKNKSKLSASWLVAGGKENVNMTSWSSLSYGSHRTSQREVVCLRDSSGAGENLLVKASFDLADIQGHETQGADLDVSPSNIWLFIQE